MRFSYLIALVVMIVTLSVAFTPSVHHTQTAKAASSPCHFIQGTRGPKFVECPGARMSAAAKSCLETAGIAVVGIAIGSPIAGATLRAIVGASVGGATSACLAKLASS